MSHNDAIFNLRGEAMMLSFLIAWLATKINCHQAHVIAYLREENRILKTKLKGKRIQLTDVERRRLAVLAHPIERKNLKDISSIATADTLQRWYRRLVVQSPRPTPRGKRIGRPHVAEEIEQLAIRMANENPRWGYRRIQGALSNVGYDIDKSTVRNILRRNHIDPAPIRGSAGMSWSQFIKLHWEVLVASGVFEARLSIFANLWTVVIQLSQNLSSRVVRMIGLIRYGAMWMRALVARSLRILLSGWLSYFDTSCCIVFMRRRRVPGGAGSPLRLVSSHSIALQVKASPMRQERSPLGAGVSGTTVASRRFALGCSASTSRLASGSRLLSLSNVVLESDQVPSQHRYEGSFTDPNQAVA